MIRLFANESEFCVPAEGGDACLDPTKETKIGCDTWSDTWISPADIEPDEEDSHQIG